MNEPQFKGQDPYSPKEMAGRVEAVGVAKANQPLVQMFMLAILAGAFIALGAAFYTVVITESGLGFGLQRLVGGVAFSLGLILVIVGGAELFTGNNLIVMAWADRKISLGLLLKNWFVVFVGNLIGAVGVALLVVLSGMNDLAAGQVGATLNKIAQAKTGLSVSEAFFRGVICNILVCLAVWLCFSARSTSSKVLVIIFPIAAFVAMGMEHSIANLYFLPAAELQNSGSVGLMAMITNLVPVTLGNIVGGGGFVSLFYWAIYLRK